MTMTTASGKVALTMHLRSWVGWIGSAVGFLTRGRERALAAQGSRKLTGWSGGLD